MDLPLGEIPVLPTQFLSAQVLNSAYVIKNKPVIIVGMASEWNATTMWKDKDYLVEKAGNTSIMYASMIGMTNKDLSEYSNSAIYQPKPLAKAL
jgi:hypothetical protein